MSEIEFIKNAIEELNKDKHIVKRMEFFKSHSDNNQTINRFEVWLQLELLHFLNTRKDISDIKIERSYDYDLRSKSAKPGRKSASIDLRYRRKSANKGIYVALELKVAVSLRNALNGSLRDLRRLRAIKAFDSKAIEAGKEQKGFDFRGIYAVSVYDPASAKTESEKSKYLKLKKTIEAHEVNLGPYKVLLFGWEARPLLGGELQSEYDVWVDALVKTCKDHGINIEAKKL